MEVFNDSIEDMMNINSSHSIDSGIYYFEVEQKGNRRKQFAFEMDEIKRKNKLCSENREFFE